MSVSIDRRAALGSIFAGLISACGVPSSEPAENNTPKPQALTRPFRETAVTPTTTPSTVASRLAELRYPEVDIYQPKGQGKFRVGRSEITWINHSDFTFFQPAAEVIFTYLSSLAARLTKINIAIEGQDFSLNVRQRPNIARKIYLIKQNQPMHSWWRNLPEDRTAVTRILGRADGTEEAFSVVRVQKPIPIGSTEIHLMAMNTDSNSQLVTEAGQSTIAFVGAGIQNNDSAQEIFCNTLGIAYFLKKRGVSYQQFLNSVTGTKITIPGLDNTFYYPLPSDEFQRLPVSKIINT